MIDNLDVLKFNDIKASTQTFIVRSNIRYVNLQTLFDNYSLSDKIVSIRYKHQTKGPVIRTEYKNFLNCVTLSMFIDKKINVKIFNNGIFQMTGCSNLNHAISGMKIILSKFIDYELKYGDGFLVYFISVMRNIDFRLNFNIDKFKLAKYIDNNTNKKVLPISYGYMGIKIKIKLDDIKKQRITELDYATGNLRIIPYEDFFRDINPDEKKLNKSSYISFSIFQNGKVLISSVDEYYQREYFDWFIDLIKRIRSDIEIKNPPMITFYDYI